MTGNRVEELEGEVQELRATVSGLTDELVETKERLRLIEEHFGPELDDIISGKVTRTEARSELSGRAQQRDQSQAPVDEEPEPEPAADAEPDPDGAADAAPDEESADEAKSAEEEPEEESAGSDDIIVA
jgi:hypothetical protein